MTEIRLLIETLHCQLIMNLHLEAMQEFYSLGILFNIYLVKILNDVENITTFKREYLNDIHNL